MGHAIPAGRHPSCSRRACRGPVQPCKQSMKTSEDVLERSNWAGEAHDCCVRQQQVQLWPSCYEKPCRGLMCRAQRQSHPLTTMSPHSGGAACRHSAGSCPGLSPCGEEHPAGEHQVGRRQAGLSHHNAQQHAAHQDAHKVLCGRQQVGPRAAWHLQHSMARLNVNAGRADRPHARRQTCHAGAKPSITSDSLLMWPCCLPMGTATNTTGPPNRKPTNPCRASPCIVQCCSRQRSSPDSGAVLHAEAHSNASSA